MTVFAMLGAARRAWFIVVAGLGLTVAVGLGVAGTTGTYWAQVDVVFLGAVTDTRPNPLGYSSQRLVDVASVIQRDVTKTTDQTQVVSPSIYLIDTGVRNGWWIRLPNSGGQWTLSYDRPALDVQVVGDTPDAVLAKMQVLLTEINAALDRRQDAARVDRDQRVTTSVSPPPAVEVHFSQGPVKRALLMTVLLGLGLTLAAADWWDRRGLGARVGRLARPMGYGGSAPERVLAPAGARR